MSTLAWVTDSGHRDTFVKTLNAQRKGGEFCDVTLKIAGRTLPSHACVLSACSPVFRELIYADRPNAPHLMTSTNAPQEIELVMPGADCGPVDSLEAMLDLLDYIYTGNIALKRQTIDMVVKLAEAFALEGLTSLVKSHVVSANRGHNRKSSETEQIRAYQDKTVREESPDPKSRSVRTKLRAVRTKSRAIRTKSRLNLEKIPTCLEEIPTKSGRHYELREQNPDQILTKSRPVRTKSRANPEKVGLSTPRASVGTGGSGQPRTMRKRRCVQVDVAADVTVGAGTDAGLGAGERRVWDTDCRIGCVRADQPPHTYSCTACDFSTGDCTEMLSHHRLVEHSLMQCSLCSSIFVDRPSFLTHLARHEDRRRPYFCRLCSYQGKSRANLAAHVAKHAAERPYKCDECDRGFKWTSSLKIHKLSHQKTKNHLCDHCGYSTSYLNNLRVHERKHNGGMFPCTQCSYQADSRSLLKRHERTHAKLKPFVCEVCGQRFAQTGSLREHSKLHNLETSQLYCHLCPYKTLRHYRLKSHVERTHGCRPPEAPAVATIRENTMATMEIH